MEKSRRSETRPGKSTQLGGGPVRKKAAEFKPNEASAGAGEYWQQPREDARRGIGSSGVSAVQSTNQGASQPTKAPVTSSLKRPPRSINSDRYQ